MLLFRYLDISIYLSPNIILIKWYLFSFNKVIKKISTPGRLELPQGNPNSLANYRHNRSAKVSCISLYSFWSAHFLIQYFEMKWTALIQLKG